MQKQWSTENTSGPDGSLQGRYARDESKSISFCVPTGLDSGESGPPGFAETGKIAEPANLVFCNVLASFLVI